LPRSLGNRLPDALTALLDGKRLEQRVGETFLLTTTDEDGWPHVAMLSAGEVLVTGPSEFRLALWPGSHTTRNLTRRRRALLMAVVPPAYYVRLECRSLGEVRPQRPLAAFSGSVVDVQEDVVGYARVVDGIRFELEDRAATVELWRSAIEALARA
jgi:hypothetical protein